MNYNGWPKGKKRPNMSGDNNPMRRTEVRAKFTGDNNPMRRSEIVEKQSISHKGCKCPDVSERNRIDNPSRYLEVRKMSRERFIENNPMSHPEFRLKVTGTNSPMKRPNDLERIKGEIRV